MTCTVTIIIIELIVNNNKSLEHCGWIMCVQIIYVFASMLEPDKPKGRLILYTQVIVNTVTNIRKVQL